MWARGVEPGYRGKLVIPITSITFGRRVILLRVYIATIFSLYFLKLIYRVVVKSEVRRE